MSNTGFMVLDVDLPGDRLVSLAGTTAKYWVGCGLPSYEGEIAGLPESVIAELITLGVIKPTHADK